MHLCACIQVRGIIGKTYMLTQDEELWQKDLPPAVEQLLMSGRDPLADRGDRGKSAAGTVESLLVCVCFAFAAVTFVVHQCVC